MGGWAEVDRIVRMDRLTNTVDGNPRWKITFEENGTLKTKPDAGFTYSMSTAWEGKQVNVEVKNGVIVDMERTACEVKGCVYGSEHDLSIFPHRVER